MTLKNNRASLLCYFKLCVSFRTHWWFQIWVTVRKRPIWVKCDDFFSRVTLKFDGWPSKTIGTSFMLLQALCSISYPLGNSNWSYSPETPNLCDLEIWRMTLKNNRAPLLCYFKLCAAFRTHWGIQTGVTVRKRPICVTLKFDGWPWKTIGHLFYATSCFVQHFVPIGEFKLELQSGNAQSGSNSTFFRAVWPWNLTDDPQQGKSEGFESCDRPIVRKCPIWVKIGDVLSRVTLKFDGWPWKTIGHLFFAVSSFVQHFIAIGEFKLELQSGKAQFGSKSTIFRAA